MARLKERVEQEQERRKRAAERQDDSPPDSTMRALPVGVRRGRLSPRAERPEGAAPASAANDLDALDRILSSAGIVRDSEALRSYLLPWLNGSDVLAFVPADRAALAGCSAVAFANRKKALLVLSSEESVTDQVRMLRQSGLEVVTLPLNPEERALEIGRLRKEQSFVLVVSLDRLFTEDALDECRTLTFDLLAIDEAQRVSELAPDFDPGVERIADLAPRLGRPPTLALLRAVPPSVRSDLPHRLGLRNPLRVDLSPVHDSIGLEVVSSDPSKRTAQVTNILRNATLPAMVLGYSMADVNDVLASLSGAGMNARRFDPVMRPSAQELTEPAVWVVPTGRVTNPIQFVRTLVHFRSPPSLEQYCRDLGWVHYDVGDAKSIMFVASDDEAMVKGTLERQRPRAEDLVGIAGVLVRHGSNASTVLLDSLCPAVGMNRTRVESLVSIFGRTGWVDHAQDWVRLRPDCPDLVERARGLGARLKTAKERDAQRLRSVSAYVVSRGCRQESLRRHFGTAGSRPCGICDACMSGRSAPQPATSGRSEEEGNSPVSRAITSDLDASARAPLGDKPAWVHRRRLVLI
ncbi:MAG: RecQ family zinc-binding domain-containing protein [Myxococcales bacterium]